jgi:foldase protein PrsA
MLKKIIKFFENLKSIKKSKLFKNKKFWITSGVIVLAAILYFARSLFVAVVVNGKLVSRYSLTRELERLGGASTLNNIIEKTLVYSEAKKLDKVVSTQEIDTEMQALETTLKDQGLTLDQALSIRGQTRQELAEQMRYQKTVEKILGEKISITEEEIAEYFKTNRATFETSDTLETVKEDITQTLFQQKLTDEYQTWLTDLQAKAKILYFVKF